LQITIADYFEFSEGWYRKSEIAAQVLEYYEVLRSVLRTKPKLRNCRTRCRHCRIFFLTDPRNAGRDDLGCPFGCRESHSKESSTKRSVDYYRTDEGKLKKKYQNEKRQKKGELAAAEESEMTDVELESSEKSNGLELEKGDFSSPSVVEIDVPREPSTATNCFELEQNQINILAPLAVSANTKPELSDPAESPTIVEVEEELLESANRLEIEQGATKLLTVPTAIPELESRENNTGWEAERWRFNPVMLEHVRMVTSLIEGCWVSLKDTVEMLVRVLRQRSMARRSKKEHIVSQLHEQPP